MPSSTNETLTLDDVRAYWGKKNIPQQWYSQKDPFTLAWYNELAFKRYNVYYEHLRETAEFQWHSGEKVLEIGCGIGTDAVEFARHGARVTAVDLGADQVMLTKLNFSLRGLPYENVTEANAENLPFDDESFDFVYSFGVIHHTPNTEHAVDEIFRVLKPDGTAIVMVYARGWKHYIKRCLIHGLLLGKWARNGFNWQRVYNDISEVHGGSPKTNVYTKRGVIELFSQFAIVEAKKTRLGEFFEYKPYNTAKLPTYIRNAARLLNLEATIGENWMVRVQKCATPRGASLWAVWFKHY
jgi:ubiquinone/menaquinone biosynthesis C-methylase UbiE